MKDEIKNLYLAVIISVVVIVLTNNYIVPKKPTSGLKPVSNQKTETISDKETDTQPIHKIVVTAPEEAQKNEKKTADNEKRIKILTPSLDGSIRIKGARIDDLILTKYQEYINDQNSKVSLLQKSSEAEPYYAEFGWVANGNIKVPDSNTIWSYNNSKLTPEKPLILKWDNGKGLYFTKTIKIDDKYVFEITETVENKTKDSINLNHYGLISKTGKPEHKKGAVHQGPVGFLNGRLEEVRYEQLQKDGTKTYVTKSGWLGITDRFWISTLAFDQTLDNVTARFIYNQTLTSERFQSDFLTPPAVVEPGGKKSFTSILFAGAKEVRTLDSYRDKFGIEKFDLAIDFGWYYFLTKPFFFCLDYFYKLIGNMGLAILLFATILRGVMFPVANASHTNMAKMKKLQPKIAELHEKYQDDKVRQQQEIMNLYKREKVNPAAGCLPVFLQIPVFFSLYKVLNISIEIRHAPFYGWIKDLSAPDPSSVFTLFGYFNWAIPDFLNIGILPLIMGVTMVVQQKLNPKPTEKPQEIMMNFMPIFFTFLLGHFAAGLVIYWTWSNLLSIIQQRAIMYKMGVDPS